MEKEHHEEDKTAASADDALEKEAKGYKALKTARWKSSGIPEDPNAPAYVASKAWMKQWKKYVGIAEKPRYAGYPYYASQQPKENTKGKERPGPISNADILEDSSAYYTSDDPDDIYNVILKPEQRERLDYKLLNDKQWEYLHGIYGGTPIKREKYKPEYYAYFQVEVYFQKINLIVLPSRDEFSVDKIIPQKALYASKRWTLLQLRERVVKVLNSAKYGYKLNVSKFRLWKLDPTVSLEDLAEKLKGNAEKIRTATIANTDPNIEDNTGIEVPGMCLDLFSNKTLEKCSIGDTDKIVLEQSNDKGEFIFKYLKNAKIGRCEFCYQDRPLVVACKCKEVFYCSESCRKKDERFHAEKCTAVDSTEDLSLYKQKTSSNMGLTGLQNLGNTCFMNSGIQCLSNTWELTRFFLEDKYATEINETNTLGTKGRLAKSYAKLMKLLWYDNSSFVSPWDLKKAVGNYHRTFSGFSQQDAQELISTVLDALHEDLNRIKKKPYIESKSTDDPADDTISVESWYNHLSRNQSIIVDLMHGQFKSIVHCTTCQRYSVTFDPFSVISLPLPQENMVTITFYYVPYDLSQPIIKCAISAEKDMKVKVFREQMAKLLGIHKDSVILTMISAGTFDRFICRERKVKLIHKLYSKRNFVLYALQINPAYLSGPEYIGVDEKEQVEMERKRAEEKQRKEAEEAQRKAAEKSMRPDEFAGNNLNRGAANYEEDKGGMSYNKNNGQYQNRNYEMNYYKKKKKADDVQDTDDYNDGLVDDAFRTYFHIYQESGYAYMGGTSKDRKSFNRMIHLKRSESLKQVHLDVFHYLRPLFDKKMQKKDQDSAMTDVDNDSKVPPLSDSDLFEKLFPGLTTENWDTKLQMSSGYPYILRFVNISAKSQWSKEGCFYCGKMDCTDCAVPYSETLKVGDMLAKLNEKEPIKNDYYYKEHAYYNENKREFEVEVVFASDKHQALVDFDELDKTEVHPRFAEILGGKDKAVSIHDCFELFSKWETLDENNLWYCNKCKNSVAAEKKMEVFKCPPILILHLKRFQVRESGMMSTTGRINVLIDFPLENLDLTKYVKAEKTEPGVEPRKPIYDLYAVSNHYGNTGFGHYTAFAYNHHAKSWYRFDDSSVSRLDKSEVCSSAAYVLFYKRRDLMTEEVDYEKLRQRPPAEFKPNVVETKPRTETKTETRPAAQTQGQRGVEEMRDIATASSAANNVGEQNASGRFNHSNQEIEQDNRNQHGQNWNK